MDNTFQQRFCTARRAVIAHDLHRLNPMQRQAAMTTEGPLLLLAGAGSGKTTVLIQRIYTLLAYGRGSDSDIIPQNATEDDLAFLENFPEYPDKDARRRAQFLCAVDPPKPWQILAITFTNKAAGEIRERLNTRLGPIANDIWASTFHSACVRILRREIVRLGFERDFTIYDADDSRRLMRHIIKDMNLDEKTFPPKYLLSVISSAKDWYLNPEEFAQKYNAEKDERMLYAAKIYAEYQKRLHTANALDFDDIIFHTVTLLKQEPEVLAYYQDKFHYVLVDEYQDTNHIQSLLTDLLSGGRRNLCVVGDDDQSIYAFRGANIENILGFEERYPDARVIRLEQNYRSTQNILNAANAVIENNMGRKGKTLWTANQKGTPVQVRTVPDEREEAGFVAGDILKSIKQGYHFRDSAVLYRMNAQSNAVEYAFKRNGIPYRMIGGVKFFDRAEIKDILAYLCVINNPLDDLRLRRIINTPARKIGNTTLEKVSTLAENQGASLYEILRNADLFPELKSVQKKLLAFADLIDSLREKNTSLSLPEFYDAVCQDSGYVQMLEEKKDAESQSRLENIRELKSNILDFLSRDPQDASLSGFLNETALYTDLDSMSQSDDTVTMMTIHAAKGLEFPIVYAVGMEEGIFPASGSFYEEEAMEEERRLCYVAMTRAKERLILTHARQRMLYGRTENNPMSRFLEELPEEQIQWEGREYAVARNSMFYGNLYRGGFYSSPSRTAPAQSGRNAAQSGNAVAQSATIAKQSGNSVKASGNAVKPSGTAVKQSENIAQASETVSEKPVFVPGDTIIHDVFGAGTVWNTQPTAGDIMIQVEFENSGMKKLMLNYAGPHIRKV